MLCLLYDSGNGFKIIAAMFGDEGLWGGLSPEEETQNYIDEHIITIAFADKTLWLDK